LGAFFRFLGRQKKHFFVFEAQSVFVSLDKTYFWKRKARSNQMKTIETRQRAWVKSLVWRIIGIVILGIITLLITNNWKAMSLITVLFHGIRIVLYYFHERIWEKISWGRREHPLSVLPVNRPIDPDDLQIIRKQLQTLGYID
jgi:uncharacterized membrane protein